MKSKFTFRQLAISVSVFIVFAVSRSPAAFASHVAGASITYLHLGGNMYRLHFAFYRDCTGITAPASVTVQASSISCGASLTYALNPLPGTGTELSHLCPGAFSNCVGGTERGFQKWEYETDVTLPAQCPDWVFTTAIASRSSCAILQLSADLMIEAHLNNSVSANNSPQFTNDPLIFACANEDFHYNNGMLDPDGDSLVYHLIDAIGVTYIALHSGQQPFISLPPVALDSLTGDYFMHPTLTECSPVVYEILDYRNGVLMGSVMRDVLMYSEPCVNQLPTATGMNGTTQQITYVLPGDTVCFDIFSDDLDVAQTLTMTWNQTIPAATFTTAGSPHPTGTFCWVPALADVRPQPYVFTATIADNNCPALGAEVYSCFIYVTLDSSLIFLPVNSDDKNLSLLISPNPSTGYFTMATKEKFDRLQIYNSFGDCVLKKNFDSTFNLSDFSAGIYWIAVTRADQTRIVQKIIKD